MKANHKKTIAALAGIVLGALAIIVSGNAAVAQDTVRVRGTIETIDGPTYVIKARDGGELKVALADKAQIAAVVKASLADIKQGLFVGVTGMPQADGSQNALEVHIFPEAMRGTGEGHYSWDLRPQSTMTNANVDQVVTAVDGQTLTLKYKNGERKSSSPPTRQLLLTCGGTITISGLARKSSSLQSSNPMERCKVARGGLAETE